MKTTLKTYVIGYGLVETKIVPTKKHALELANGIKAYMDEVGEECVIWHYAKNEIRVITE